MAGHTRDLTTLQEHKFDTKKGEYVTLVEWNKKERAFRWLDPRTWLYLWYSNYEIHIEWNSRFALDLTYVDAIVRIHADGQSLAVTLVPTFFRCNPSAVEELECSKENCMTVVTIPEAEQIHFSLSTKLIN
jgi:hypothetical protein